MEAPRDLFQDFRLAMRIMTSSVHLILSTLIKKTRSSKPVPAERAVAVLMALHAVEANHEVAKSSVPQVVERHLASWEVAPISPQDLQKDLLLLQEHGAILGTPESPAWKMGERLSYPW